MQLIDGKAVAEQVKQEIAAQVAAMVERGEKRPHLAAILVTKLPSSTMTLMWTDS